MLERPDLTDAQISAHLRQHYGYPITGVEFLPIGNAPNTWVFRVYGAGGARYFLKIKRRPISESSLSVPRYLKDQGIDQVVAPIPSNTHRLWHRLADFGLILYPLIDGQDVMTVGMPDDHWIELGDVLRRIHATPLGPELARQMKRETFAPKWLDLVRALQAQGIQGYDPQDSFVRELASFWQAKRDEIGYQLARSDALARRMRDNPPPFVLCHADIHTANILIDGDDRIHIVDWDETVIAPKERDLMFVTGTGIDHSAEFKEEELFYQGYGVRDINRDALAYYRYDWVIQEIGDYSARILGILDGGDETKQSALRELVEVFEPHGVVDAAYQTDPDHRWPSHGEP